MPRRLKILSLGFVVFLLPLAWAAPEGPAYEGDTVHSYVLFKVKHLGTSWSYGRFNDFKVSVRYDAARPADASVAFDVNAESVDTGNAKRDQHLRSPDFLNAKEFPRITFKSTGVKPLGSGEAEVTGDLSLHGVTKPVTVRVVKVGEGKDMKGAAIVGFEAAFTVKRSDFGMDKMIGPVGDEVVLTVAVEGARK